MTDGVKLQVIFNEFIQKIKRINQDITKSLEIISNINDKDFSNTNSFKKFLNNWIGQDKRSSWTTEQKDSFIDAALAIIKNNSIVLQNSSHENKSDITQLEVISNIVSFLEKNAENIFNFLVCYVDFVHTIESKKLQKTTLQSNPSNLNQQFEFRNKSISGVQALTKFNLLIQDLILNINPKYKDKNFSNAIDITNDKDYQTLSEQFKNRHEDSQPVQSQADYCLYLLLHLQKDILTALETSEKLNRGPCTPKKQSHADVRNKLEESTKNNQTPLPPQIKPKSKFDAVAITYQDSADEAPADTENNTDLASSPSSYSPSEEMQNRAQNIIKLSTKAYKNDFITKDKHEKITEKTNLLLNNPTETNLNAYNQETKAITTTKDNTLLGLGLAITAFAQVSVGFILLGTAAAMMIMTAGGSLPISISLGFLAKVILEASLVTFFTATTLMSTKLARYAGKHSLFNEIAMQANNDVIEFHNESRDVLITPTLS